MDYPPYHYNPLDYTYQINEEEQGAYNEHDETAYAGRSNGVERVGLVEEDVEVYPSNLSSDHTAYGAPWYSSYSYSDQRPLDGPPVRSLFTIHDSESSDYYCRGLSPTASEGIQATVSSYQYPSFEPLALRPQPEIEHAAPSVVGTLLSPDDHDLDGTFPQNNESYAEPWSPFARGLVFTPGEVERATTPSPSAPYFLGEHQYMSHASRAITEPEGTRPLSSRPNSSLESTYLSQTSATVFNWGYENRMTDSFSTLRSPSPYHNISQFGEYSLSTPLQDSGLSSPPSPSIADAGDDICLRCEDCGAHFSGTYRRGNLGRHRRQKHASTDYPCESDSCERVFKRQDARLKHYRKKHPNLAQGPVIGRNRYEQNVYHYCTEPGCGRKFDTPGELSRHQRTHLLSSERPHKCQACDQSFLYPKDLRRHGVTHRKTTATGLL
jgi:hypothetical protein